MTFVYSSGHTKKFGIDEQNIHNETKVFRWLESDSVVEKSASI